MHSYFGIDTGVRDARPPREKPVMSADSGVHRQHDPMGAAPDAVQYLCATREIRVDPLERAFEPNAGRVVREDEVYGWRIGCGRVRTGQR